MGSIPTAGSDLMPDSRKDPFLSYIESKCLYFAKEKGILEHGEHVLCAVSGGIDSVSMLLILYALRSEMDITLSCAHLDHKLRPTSHEEAMFVRKTCEELNIPVVIGEEDVKRYDAFHPSHSLEENAREVRYRFLNHVANDIKADKIAIAHNMDDSVETFFMRVIRGTDLKGITSIPVRAGKIIRPILCLSRNEIRKYVKIYNVRYVVDESNYDIRYTRNRVRHVLLPYVQREFDPKVKEHIYSLVNSLREVDEYVEQKAKEIYDRILTRNKAYVELDMKSVYNIESLLIRRVIALSLEHIRGIRIERSKIDMIYDLIKGFKNGTVTLGAGFVASINYGKLKISISKPVAEFCKELNPGRNVVEELNCVINMEISKKDIFSPEEKDIAFFDADEMVLPIYVRNWKKGDRIEPFGMHGSQKKVQDVFTDNKIDRDKRQRIPIFVDGKGRILWVYGLKRSRLFPIKENTKKVLKISVKTIERRKLSFE